MKIKFYSLAFIYLIFLIGCGKDKKNPPTANPTYNCLYPDQYGQCQNYQYNGNYGLYPYPMDQQGYYQGRWDDYSNGFCCNDNRVPIYYPDQWGLLCMRGNLFAQDQYYTWNFRANWNFNYGWNTGFYGGGGVGRQSGCTHNLAQGCDPRRPSSCYAGYCRETYPGSFDGICVRY